MTLIASILFLSALVVSTLACLATISRSMPRINEVIAEEFGPTVQVKRKVTFGVVKHQPATRSAEVIFLRPISLNQGFKLAA